MMAFLMVVGVPFLVTLVAMKVYDSWCRGVENEIRRRVKELERGETDSV